MQYTWLRLRKVIRTHFFFYIPRRTFFLAILVYSISYVFLPLVQKGVWEGGKYSLDYVIWNKRHYWSISPDIVPFFTDISAFVRSVKLSFLVTLTDVDHNPNVNNPSPEEYWRSISDDISAATTVNATSSVSHVNDSAYYVNFSAEHTWGYQRILFVIRLTRFFVNSLYLIKPFNFESIHIQC